ncbi:Aste57867_457 [Aphanomyces stellatus]|uniref:Aste57867_457 protein n=1 Tax=Aphanomyces stellatus TaxID=120398 RepID=A0A485K2P5_9STRA|nr:hypothetical protein As57867_000456 [Aphanomyces stellatus]VFT77682.1 Aste57867_457 [Aphanomyces stellatus]
MAADGNEADDSCMPPMDLSDMEADNAGGGVLRVEMLRLRRASAVVSTEGEKPPYASTTRSDTVRGLEVAQVEMLENHMRDLHAQLDEVERARQHAVFKISEMSAQPSTKAEWIDKLKHDFELLNQRSRLLLAQQEERHSVALELALRKLALEHGAAVERMALESKIRATEWRHEEARRAKEIEAAMEADKCSVRLEMKHSIETARIHQKVSILPAAASGPPADGDVIVRMQMEALRMRRMDALKKLCLVRSSYGRMRLKTAWNRWSVVGQMKKTTHLHAGRLLGILLSRWHQHVIRRRFHAWHVGTKVHMCQTIHSSVLNRILAVERISHLAKQHARMKQLRAFVKWRNDAMCGGSGREATQLRNEITKLHDELAKTKAETWRCKRQMLQQFKQSAM